MENHILHKNHNKIAKNFGNFAKIIIWNLKNSQNFENCRIFKSVVETFFHRVFFIVYFEFKLRIDENFAIQLVGVNSIIFSELIR